MKRARLQPLQLQQLTPQRPVSPAAAVGQLVVLAVLVLVLVVLVVLVLAHRCHSDQQAGRVWRFRPPQLPCTSKFSRRRACLRCCAPCSHPSHPWMWTRRSLPARPSSPLVARLLQPWRARK